MYTLDIKWEGGGFMGFFDSFSKAYHDNKDNKEIIEMYHDLAEDDSDYRKKAFDNSDSNYGWYQCSKCGRKFRKSEMDVDHILPKSKGGSNSRYNLQILCQHCNRSKQADTSETADDLARRNQELKKQDKDDLEFLNAISRRKK